MKLISKAALAVALTAGLSTAVVVAPAAAQKKDNKKQEAAPGLKLSDPVRKAIAAAQTAWKANDVATTETQLAAAEAAATTDDEKYAVAAMKLPVVAKANDRAKLLPVLDTLIANPKTPQADLPRYTFFRGAMAFEQKKYAEALPLLQRAQQLGYKDDNLALQIAQAQIETGNVDGGVAAIQSAIDAETAAGRKAPESWYSYAVAKLFTAGRKAETAQWLSRALDAYPTPQNWRKSLFVYRDSMDAKGGKPLTRGERIDLFRLMRGTKALADQSDYLEYAELAFTSGLPSETQTVLNEGKATGKIPAGNAAATRLLADAANAIKAEGSLAGIEKQAMAAATGKTAAQTGDAYLGQGNNAKAIALYKAALQKGGVDASEVNMHLGVAYAQAGQKEDAKAAFRLVTAAPRSDIAKFWLQYLDQNPAAAAPAPAATN